VSTPSSGGIERSGGGSDNTRASKGVENHGVRTAAAALKEPGSTSDFTAMNKLRENPAAKAALPSLELREGQAASSTAKPGEPGAKKQDSTTDSRVPIEAQNLHPNLKTYKVKQGDNFDSIAKDQLPGSSEFDRGRYKTALMAGNDTTGEHLKPGSQIKLPENKDGTFTAQHGDRTLVTRPDGSYNLFNKGQGEGAGRDSDTRRYNSSRAPDGSIKHSYEDGSQTTTRADGTGGSGREANGREYSFTNNSDGSVDRTYKDNGAQSRTTRDGTTFYKGPKSDDPKTNVLEMRNRNGDVTYRQNLTPEESNMSMDDALRNEAVLNTGGQGLIPKGRNDDSRNIQAGSTLLNEAAQREAARAGGGEPGKEAVKKMFSDIQAKLRDSTQDPNAQFDLESFSHEGKERYSAKQTVNYPEGGSRTSRFPIDMN
jgi:hypothetical protein